MRSEIFLGPRGEEIYFKVLIPKKKVFEIFKIWIYYLVDFEIRALDMNS